MLNNIVYILAISAITSCHSKKLQSANDSIPSCLREKINAMQKEDVPQSVSQFLYEGHKVFYVVSSCCDKYNYVYDSACNIIGAPDGGFTGRGDGNLKDFKNKATNEKVIWKKEY